MKKVIKIGFWIILIGVIIWFAVGIIDSCRDESGVKPPDINKAIYRVTIQSNQNVLYTNNYNREGSIHHLNGYFEQIKGKYKYRDTILSLDEYSFGKVNVTVRK